MPRLCAPSARTMAEVRLQAPYSVATPEFAAMLSEIRSCAAHGLVSRFILDCGRITELTRWLATDLVELRDTVREMESDLVLINCPATLRQALAEHQFAVLSGEPPVRHLAHPQRRPHATFMRNLSAGA
jgi:hypothetical protein